MVDVACFAAMTAGAPWVHNDIDPERDQFSRNLGERSAASLRPAKFDRDVAAIDPAEFAQPLHESSDPGPWHRARVAQGPDGPQLPPAARVPRAATLPPRRQAA